MNLAARPGDSGRSLHKYNRCVVVFYCPSLSIPDYTNRATVAR